MEGGQMQAMLLEFLMDQGEPLSASSSEQHHGPVSQQPGPVGTDTVRRPTLSSNTHSGLHQAEAQHPLTNRRSVNGGVAFPSWTLPSITPPANSSPVFAGLASGGSSYPPWTSAPSLQTQSRETQGVAYGNNPPAGSPWTCNPQTPELPPFSSLPHQLPNESFHPLPGGGFGGGNYFEGTRAQLGNGNTNWSNQRPLLSHQTLSNHYSNTSTPAIPTGLDVAPPSSVQMPASTQRNVRAKQRSQEHMLEAQLQAKLAELRTCWRQSLPTPHPKPTSPPTPTPAPHPPLSVLATGTCSRRSPTHTPPHPTPHPNPNPTPTPAPLCAGHRNVLEAVVPVRDSSLAFLTKAAAIMKAPQPRWGAPHIVPSHTSLACSVFLPTNWDSPQALETIRSTSPAQFRALWRSFLRETAFLVLAAEAHGVVSEAHDRLAMLVLQVSVITSSGLQGMGTWQGVVSEARDRLALLGLQVSVIRSSGLQGMGTWQGVVSEARDRLALLGLQVSVITSSGLQGMGTWQGVVSEAHDRLALLVLQVSVITSSGLQGMGTWTGVVSEARDRLAMLLLQSATPGHGDIPVTHSFYASALQAMSVFDKIILLAPDSFSGSMYVHLETGEPAAPDDSFWRSVAQALAPSDKQVHRDLPRQRAQQPDGHPAAHAGHLHALLGGHLQRAAQCTMADFLSSLVLTPLQVVKMAAVSYPYFPDGVAITHACVQLAAESAPGRKGDLTGLDQGPRTASTDAPQNSGTGKRCVVARTTNSD
ncbi:MAG: hypothetical protein WDW38_004029 [Sanguina aurantia]